MARRKIHTKIEDLRKLVASEIQSCTRQIANAKRAEDWQCCVDLRSCRNTYEFILKVIDEQPEEPFDYTEEYSF